MEFFNHLNIVLGKESLQTKSRVGYIFRAARTRGFTTTVFFDHRSLSSLSFPHLAVSC